MALSTDASLLARQNFVFSNSLTSLQSQVDSLVGGFTAQATDWRSLAAMMAGGVTYRLGRVGALSVSANSASLLRGLAKPGLAMAAGTGRLASVGIGLGAEVTAFEMTNRSLSSLTGGMHSNTNLWRWEGHGGIRQGLLSSLVTFGTLKGAGSISQGENLVVQHLLQDLGMVMGHNVFAVLDPTLKPTGTLAEQFLHAEAVNLQMGAGMALAHGLAPRIQGLERGLDLALRSSPPSEQRFPEGQPVEYMHGGEPFSFARIGDRQIFPHVLWMSGGDREKRGRELSIPQTTGSAESGQWRRTSSVEAVIKGPVGLDEKSRNLAEASTEAVFTIDERTLIVYANPALARFLGYETTQDLIGRPFSILIPPSLRRAHEAGLKQYLATGEGKIDWTGVDLPTLHKGGDWLSAHFSFQEYERSGRRFFSSAVLPNDAEVRRSSDPEGSALRTPLPLNRRTGESWESAFEYSTLYQFGQTLKAEDSPLLSRLDRGDLFVRVQEESPANAVGTYLQSICMTLSTKMRSRKGAGVGSLAGGVRVRLEVKERGQSARRIELIRNGDSFTVSTENAVLPEESPVPPAGATSGGGSAPVVVSRGSGPDRSGIFKNASAVGQGTESPVTESVRLRDELLQAASAFREKLAGEEDIELPIPGRWRREFLSARVNEVLERFDRQVWGYMIRPGRKVRFIFETEEGRFRIELQKAEVGYRLGHFGPEGSRP
jgi:PAS domain S-box-containing protein